MPTPRLSTIIRITKNRNIQIVTYVSVHVITGTKRWNLISFDPVTDLIRNRVIWSQWCKLGKFISSPTGLGWFESSSDQFVMQIKKFMIRSVIRINFPWSKFEVSGSFSDNFWILMALRQVRKKVQNNIKLHVSTYEWIGEVAEIYLNLLTEKLEMIRKNEPKKLIRIIFF